MPPRELTVDEQDEQAVVDEVNNPKDKDDRQSTSVIDDLDADEAFMDFYAHSSIYMGAHHTGELDRTPFLRSRPMPQDPPKKLSRSNWKQYEKVGETYFTKDEDDETGFTALQIVAIIILEGGKIYEIRYEELDDSFPITEREMLNLVDDGMWL